MPEGLGDFRHLDNALWYQSGLGRFFWSMDPWRPAEDWPPPFPNVACGGCKQLLPADTKRIVVYHREGGQLCRLREAFCDYCRGEIGEMDEWPRGPDGRFLKAVECS